MSKHFIKEKAYMFNFITNYWNAHYNPNMIEFYILKYEKNKSLTPWSVE